MPRFTQRLTQSGLLCLIGGIVAIIAAWKTGNALSFFIGYALLIGLAIQWLLSRLCIQNLKVDLEPAAPHARAYASFPFHVQIRNASQWFPVHSPKLKIVESGRHREFTLNVPQTLGPGQSANVSFHPQFGRRGKQRLTLTEAYSYFPFGLTRSATQCSQVSPSVKVWPERMPIPVELFQNWEYQTQSEAMPRHSAAVDAIDRNRFRDYMPGDSMRRINWKLSAKTGKLTVSENPNSSPTRIWLLINSHPSHWNRPVDFENGIRLLGTAMGFCFKRRTLAGVAINDIRIPIRSHSDWELAMDRISELNWEHNVDSHIPKLERGEFLVYCGKRGPRLIQGSGRSVAV